MDITPFIDTLRQDLAVAAEAGGDQARDLAERLTAPLEKAARLVLLEALAQAAEEISLELVPGSVEVRLRGRQADFIVTSPEFDDVGEGGIETSQGHQSEAAGSGRTPAGQALIEGEDGGTSRITLRLPDQLKQLVEEAARGEGLSVNAWLVRAVAASLDGGGPRPDTRRTRQIGRGHTGWVR
jgi:hypothetical protein